MRRVILCLCITLLNISAYSQEILTGLHSNTQMNVFQKHLFQLQQKKVQSFIFHSSLALPFTEDFSTSIGYPDTALWIDNYAFINQSFAINAPSFGVATLDAVDQYGKIYEHAGQTAFSADTLTSKPIRLDSIFSPLPKRLTPSDSVYFSFFYQPGGGLGQPWNRLGNAPESTDSLVLEFGYYTGDTVLAYYTYRLYIADTSFSIGDTIFSMCDPSLFIIAGINYKEGDSIYLPCDSVLALESKWKHVWSSAGMTMEAFIENYSLDTNKLLFRQVMIPITDSVFFNKGFQFRFRNYASLEYNENNPTWASNVDFWNIDYVRLDRARTINDTVIDDVAFSKNPGSVLANYQAMPWSQFKNNQGKELVKKLKVKLSNLSEVEKNTSYRYVVTDDKDQAIGNYDGGSYNISPVYSHGFQTYNPHSSPDYTTNFPANNNDSALFKIVHIFKEAGSGDKNQKNDTIVFEQKFYNYFAYDDGIPESGYTVINAYSDRTAMAMGFKLHQDDTLRAIAMYINHVLNNENDFQFTLSVWADSSNYPGKLIYHKVINQEYSNELYGLQHYYLSEPVPISGKFYIGYQIETKNYLNVGFDQNCNASAHVYYKTGKYWEKSFLAGTPMLRPYIGNAWEPVAINDIEETRLDVRIYPNPANDKIQINLSDPMQGNDLRIEIYSLNGQKVYNGNFTNNIDVSNLKSGFYILKTHNTKTKEIRHFKFIIQR